MWKSSRVGEVEVATRHLREEGNDADLEEQTPVTRCEEQAGGVIPCWSYGVDGAEWLHELAEKGNASGWGAGAGK